MRKAFVFLMILHPIIGYSFGSSDSVAFYGDISKRYQKLSIHIGKNGFFRLLCSQSTAHIFDPLPLYEGIGVYNGHETIVTDADSTFILSYVILSDTLIITSGFEFIKNSRFLYRRKIPEASSLYDMTPIGYKYSEDMVAILNSTHSNILKNEYSSFEIDNNDSTGYSLVGACTNAILHIKFLKRNRYRMYTRGFEMMRGEYFIKNQVLALKNPMGKILRFSMHKSHIYPLQPILIWTRKDMIFTECAM